MQDLKLAMELASKVNLCTYFVLPLTTYNVTRFGGTSNFLNSYLSRDGKFIFVEVKDLKLIDANLQKEPEFHLENKTLIMLDIPEQWYEDVDLFIKGSYTKMSEKAKNEIRRGSTLEYQRFRGSVCTTDYRLLALNSSPNLRNALEATLYDSSDALYRNELGEELLSIPDESSFI